MRTVLAGRWAVLFTALFVGCAGAEGSADKKESASAATASQVAPSASQGQSDQLVSSADQGRIRGDSAAKVWMIIVSDFECPYCKMWHDSTDAVIRRDYVDNGKVRMAFMNYPMQQHVNAMPAAEAAMCASAQGKFWDLHDAIFESQAQWNKLPNASAFFDSLAVRVGVNVPEFRECLSSQRLRPLIQADFERSKQAGVNATPSFLIGGQRYSGVLPTATLRSVLDSALASGTTAK